MFPEGTADKFTKRVDENALAIYERNLRNIISLNRSMNRQTIFIPQVLNYPCFENKKNDGWAPFINYRDVKIYQTAYNDRMQKVAREAGIDFFDEVLKANWGTSDFNYDDYVHLSPAGGKKFAQIVGRRLSGSWVPPLGALTSREPRVSKLVELR